MTITETPTIRSSFRNDLWVVTGRTLQHWRAQPGPLLVTLLFPVLIVLMMGGLFGGAIAGHAGDYMPYVVPGMFALTMFFGIESTMTAITTDASKGVTDRFRSLPMHSLAFVGGRCAADMLLSVLGLAVMTVAGLALGWRWENGIASAAAAYALLLLLRFGLLWVGLYAGLKAPGPEAVVAVQVLVWPVGFLSTVFVDANTMPSWLGWLAEWNPLSATANAVRELFGNPGVSGGSWPAEHALLLAIAGPLLLTVIFAPLSARTYRELAR